MKNEPHPRELSVASMRPELLERLGVLFPGKSWSKRVAAREVAAFAIAHLPESAIHKLPTSEQSGAFRALHLAETIRSRKPQGT